jgi:hypothetical protein
MIKWILRLFSEEDNQCSKVPRCGKDFCYEGSLFWQNLYKMKHCFQLTAKLSLGMAQGS